MAEMMQTDYAYSLNEENYSGTFPTRDAALEEALELAEDGDETAVYTGVCVPWLPRIDGARVLEQASEDAYDAVGEVAADWLTHNRRITLAAEKELGDRLTAVLHEWLEEVGETPTFYSVESVERHPVPRPIPTPEAPHA